MIKQYKTNIALCCIIGMFAGFLASRLFLSLSMILFGINALWGVKPKYWFAQKWWLIGASWVALYALTFFWSDDKAAWGTHMDTKLPILLLPLSFAFLPGFKIRQLGIFTLVAGLLLVGGAIYSTSFLINNVSYYMYEYHMAHVLPTPNGDHIRFSLCITLFFIWCAYLWPKLENNTVKWIVGIIMALLSIYLHLLAARTGLVLWYMFIVAWAIHLGLKKSKMLGLGILMSLAAFAFLAVEYIPTLNKRVGYLNYSYIMYKQGDASGLYSDINRLMSYKIANKLVRQQPLTGVGTGDMMTEMRKGYAASYPEVHNDQHLLPHNQFLLIALASGIPALILFTWWLLSPLLLIKNNSREAFFFFITWITIFLPMMFEPMLEIQYGVFVSLFFLLWQRHSLLHKSTLEEEAYL